MHLTRASPGRGGGGPWGDPQLGFPHFTRSGSQSLRMVVPGRHGLRRCRSVAGTSKNPPLSMRGLAARGDDSALTVGHVHVRAPADRCRRKLVTHVVLTVRCANVRKIIAEKMRRTAEGRGGRVPPPQSGRHTASAALSGPPHLLRDEIWRIVEQARATAMTWHPCRVPLPWHPCRVPLLWQIAESRAQGMRSGCAGTVGLRPARRPYRRATMPPVGDIPGRPSGRSLPLSL